ncbi:hypothetical protein ACFLRN_08895 [Thermoproteota archaeon]
MTSLKTAECSECNIEIEESEKDLCEVCGEITELREELTNNLSNLFTDETTRNNFLKNINNLIELSKESQWRQDKDRLIKTILSEQLEMKTAWRLFVVLQSVKDQSQHLEDLERDLLPILRNEFRYSLNTIGLILGRSKETIHRHAGAAERLFNQPAERVNI